MGSWSGGTRRTTNAGRCPIPKFLVDELDALKAGKGPKDLMFTGDRGGVLRNGNFRRDIFNAAAVKGGPRRTDTTRAETYSGFTGH